ncbi:TIGR00375 family protein [Methanosphaera sp. WGK6]|uniref:TIGR00375 family protein n=1 Tax=Methanosphaera sp. WGK6 TaxID=1561964 RepID=UPI00084BE880|nr:TIGR00375 family protein [Methanosphaera sp. WGK6]OED30922.1 phosphotransferase [Methanosphaera sp. WGK6]
MIINADLHVHSKYSMATSKNMDPRTMATESVKKGLNLVATGDALHSGWLNELEESLVQIDDSGIYETNNTIPENNTKFITTTEVEDNQRIHHLIIIPSIETAWQMRDEFTVKNMDADGRPRIRMNGAEIMDIARDYNCIIGPAHIFTPWTGLYKSYDHICDCYGQKPDFVELGLSSDSDLADTIDELKEYTFLTNSDSHSPWPHRIGREFNKIDLKELSFRGLEDAIKNNNVVENYGFDPRMGKYHETGCIQCYEIYNIHEAIERDMKCSCGGRIKKGVKGRIQELASYDEPHHPEDRPHYQYLLPLAELLSVVHDKGVTTKYVQTRYDKLLTLFGNEIDVLLNTPLEKIEEVDMLLARVIKSYRNNSLDVSPGRGGQYGQVEYN